MTHPTTPAVLTRLVAAINEHDLEAMGACFTVDYVNHTPAHPARGFVGRDQVARNWAQIFGRVPDVRASLTRTVLDGETVWSEWEISGTRDDSAPFLMRGVVIFGLERHAIGAATFYLEPVDRLSGGPDHALEGVLGGLSHPKEQS